ncbi:MAG: outer membrane protein assembly factor BamA [Deltaproteobacteria bacterium]|nr:outer membrane protein assembly factor BamA [Deltaproteobacteria bacterium]
MKSNINIDARFRAWHRRLAWLLPAFVCLLAICSATEAAPIIRKIEIVGNRRIDSGTLLSRIQSKKGESLSMETIRKDIRAIYGMGGYFENVQVESEPVKDGIRLIFRVKEKPIISEITIKGNKELEEGKIRDVLKARIGSPYDLRQIKRDREAIRKLYRDEGFYFAKIQATAKDDRNKNKKLHYKISEGKKVIIGEIILKGSKQLKPGEIKKKAMETKEHWMLSFISSAGVYKRETLNIDLARIKDFYYSHGYLEVKVGEPEISFKKPKRRTHDRFYEWFEGWGWGKSKIVVTIPIHEGKQYKIGKVRFEGNNAISSEILASSLSSKKGEIFSSEKIRKDISIIAHLYGKKGYAFANGTPLTNLHRETRTVDLTWDIDEGQRVYIGEVNILGNVRTRDNVIRRELRFNEGDRYNIAKIDRSKVRIRNTGFFKDVQIRTNRRPGRQVVDLNVLVKEQQTGSLSFGIGASSTQGLIGSFDVQQKNIFGTGREVNISAVLGGKDSSFNLRFVEPWLYDREVSLGFNLYKNISDYDSFREETLGGGMTFGRALDEYSRGSIGINYEDIHYNNVDQGYNANLIQGQSVSDITLGWKRNTVDNIMDPTRGYLARASAKLAGLIGNAKFNKYYLADRIFIKGPGKITFSENGEVGYIKASSAKEIPVSELYYLGGIESLRGYQYRSLGPRNFFGSLIGGRKMLLSNSEIYFPVAPSAGLKGFLFFDIGKVYDPVTRTVISSYREIDTDGDGFVDTTEAVRSPNITDGNQWKRSYGIGISWRSPAGPIKLVWAKAMNPEAFDNVETIQFSMGTTF